MEDFSSSPLLNQTEEKQSTHENNHEITPMCEFYKDKVIFLTGGSGFLGKVIVEKLLRCCPEIKMIYLLMRSKKGKSCHLRLKEMTDSKIFDKLRKINEKFHESLCCIEGDVTMPNLGIRQADAEILAESVSIVYHSAATIRFDEHLKVAVNTNVRPVKKLIQLCRTFKHLQVMVHVSTAYANCHMSVIEEKVYPVVMEPEKLLNTLEWMDDAMVTSITPKLLGEWPNTYTYTKHLAEHILVTEGEGLPIAIVRPSIIGAAWKEPLPGWIDNYSGPSGLYIATGKGMLRSMRCKHTAVADIVPVDFPANTIIAVAWYTAVIKPTATLR